MVCAHIYQCDQLPAECLLHALVQHEETPAPLQTTFHVVCSPSPVGEAALDVSEEVAEVVDEDVDEAEEEHLAHELREVEVDAGAGGGVGGAGGGKEVGGGREGGGGEGGVQGGGEAVAWNEGE